jgi:hypothetical protein
VTVHFVRPILNVSDVGESLAWFKGKAGIGGDGGPALRARLGEITSLAEDRTGQIYVSEVHNGVVRRFVPGGRMATVARVPGVVGIDIDPGGRYLAIASIERGPNAHESEHGRARDSRARWSGR